MVEALSRIRAGDLNAATLSFIAKCQRPLTEDDGILSTVLCCTSYTHTHTPLGKRTCMRTH